MSNKIVEKVTRLGGSVGYQLKKHSPEILMVVGIAGTIASTVMACKATTKIGDILDEASETIDNIHRLSEDDKYAEEKYTKEDAKKDLVITYAQTGVQLAKLYGPSVILGGLSITSILASNNILKKRNVALAAAYATVDKGFKEYRARVVEKFGEDVDKELKYGIKAKKIEEIEIDEETGKEKKVKKTVGVSEISEYSDYAVYFDNRSECYEGNPDYDMMFLKGQMRYANDLLRAKGYLTLLEVYESLGVKVTELQRKAAMVVGWKYEDNNEVGDNDVVFYVIDTYRENADGTIEPCIILDFNVDGCIYDRM